MKGKRNKNIYFIPRKGIEGKIGYRWKLPNVCNDVKLLNDSISLPLFVDLNRFNPLPIHTVAYRISWLLVERPDQEWIPLRSIVKERIALVVLTLSFYLSLFLSFHSWGIRWRTKRGLRLGEREKFLSCNSFNEGYAFSNSANRTMKRIN